MSNIFNGFPTETFKFLKDLKANNNRDWFNKNRTRYDLAVLEPSLQFIDSMQGPLKKISPFFLAVPKRSGGSLMRIYRDIRFSKEKTPYKTNIGIHFRHEMGRDVHAPGYYLHIEDGDCFFGAGIWHPNNEALRKIRDQIVELDARWKRISRSKQLLRDFEFAGDSLKRPPRDFDPAHPLVNDLKRKDFIMVAKIAKNELIDRKLPERTGRLMKQTSGIVEFLCEALRLPFK